MQGVAPLARPAPRSASVRVSTTGRLFISVMLILILEGAVRKWVTESSTLPLILLRDLLAAFTVARALGSGHFRRFPNLATVMLAWSCCVLGWGLLQLTLGESGFAVLAIGLRFWLLYIWFALAAACGMNERDYVAAVRVLLGALVLTAPLAALQHLSPPGAFINKSLDADEESVFLVIQGVVRTTGTFSFTSGYNIFINVCVPFALGAFNSQHRKFWHRILSLAILGALVICTLVSGARAAIINTGAMVVLFLLGNLLFAPMRRKGAALVAAVVAVLVVGAMTFIFQGAVEATQERFQTAAQGENVGDRVLAIFFGEHGLFDKFDWLGAGIGIGSNLAQYVQTGRSVFVFGETESARTMAEGGLMGALFILFKLCIATAGLLTGWKRALATNSAFPVLVWVAASLALFTWPAIGQLTANGFLGVLLTLGMLALRYPKLRIFG